VTVLGLWQYGLTTKNYIMGNIKIFEKHFRKGMINKDFGAFKKNTPDIDEMYFRSYGRSIATSRCYKIGLLLSVAR
jgi:hypothetical protein